MRLQYARRGEQNRLKHETKCFCETQKKCGSFIPSVFALHAVGIFLRSHANSFMTCMSNLDAQRTGRTLPQHIPFTRLHIESVDRSILHSCAVSCPSLYVHRVHLRERSVCRTISGVRFVAMRGLTECQRNSRLTTYSTHSFAIM